MKNTSVLCILVAVLLIAGCSKGSQKTRTDMEFIPIASMEEVTRQLIEQHGEEYAGPISRGAAQVAALWQGGDGSPEEYVAFCLENYAGGEAARHELFTTLSRNFEYLWGHFNQLSLELTKPLHLDWGPISPVDVLFGSYAAGAHLAEDFYRNRIAFITILNFPFYSLEEKNALGRDWDRRQWAYARMGDLFNARVPARVNQHISRVGTEADNYVSEYNIVMGQLRNEQGEQIFPDHLKLISHWGLRDELKSNYSESERGLERQRMIYQVMQRIIDQSIPEAVINNETLHWKPYSNQLIENGEVVEASPEPDTRYWHLLENFHARRQADPYSPSYPTAIERTFQRGLELSIDDVEALFIEVVSSPVLKETGQLISHRLGRPLEAFDIWYDGFKARSAIPETELDRVVREKYPDAGALEADLPNILVSLGYERNRANKIASRIVVEGSRGAGHAWGGQMRSQFAHLRTRIADEGMTYNGFNIAVHELGHNVEQTISLQDVDYYMLIGVPNTAFTEALAFIFQTRDLELLGFTADDPMSAHMKTLDILWGTYEIMGVSLVDMQVWKWLYENPDTTPARLKAQTIDIAREVWNNYFAPVFGIQDSPILAIYSHMISYPLYLSAYPLGHLIEFQLEGQKVGKDMAVEIDRIFSLGRLTPRQWMLEAVGQPVSGQPLLVAAAEALTALSE